MKLNKYQKAAMVKVVEERIPRLRKEYEAGSTATIGKFSETLRNILNERPRDVIRCRAANRVDIRIGRNRYIEVKTGSGAVAYAEETAVGYFTNEDLSDRYLLKGCNEIIWMPFPPVAPADIFNLTDAEAAVKLLELFLKNSWVFSRDEFIDMLSTIGKNGLKSSLKVSKNGRQLNIQTITPRMEGRFWDYVEGRPTAYEELL